MSNKTPLADFFGELNGGVFQEKIEAYLSQVALATITQADKKKKGKIAIELDFEIVNDDLVKIEHKLDIKTPTLRGHKIEVDKTETPMYVGRGGKMTISPPRENHVGQTNFQLQQEQDGIDRNNIKPIK